MKQVVFRAVTHLLPISVALSLVLFCGACASKIPPHAELERMNALPPTSRGDIFGADGYLVVNTPQEMHYDEHSVRRFPRTGYSIYTLDTHHLLQYVHNRDGVTGETPTIVMLPAGPYLVEAQTVYHRPVSFTVVVRPRVTTTVSLDGDLLPPKDINGEFYALEFQGRPIGWAMDSVKY